MKKRVIVLLTFIMLFALVACGTDGTNDVVNSETNNTTENVGNSENNDQKDESDTESETEVATESDNLDESEDATVNDSETEDVTEEESETEVVTEEESETEVVTEEESETDDSNNGSDEYEFEGIYWGEGPDGDMDGVPDGAITRIYYFDGKKCTISRKNSSETEVYEYVVKSGDGMTIEFYENGSLSFDKTCFMYDGMLCFTFQDVDFGGYIQCVIVDNQFDFE